MKSFKLKGIVIDDSKFSMWRACIGVIYLDKKVTKEEKKWAEEKFEALNFSEEQKAILVNDLANGVAIESLHDKITDKRDMAFLLHMMRVISNLDNNFSSEEKAAYQKLENSIMKKIDVQKITNEVKAIEVASYHEDEVYRNNNPASFLEGLFNAFRKYLNPGDYKLP